MKTQLLVPLFLFVAIVSFSQTQTHLQVVDDSVRISNGEFVLRNNNNYLYGGSKLIYTGSDSISLSTTGNLLLAGNQGGITISNGVMNMNAYDLNITGNNSVKISNLYLPQNQLNMGDWLGLSGSLLTSGNHRVQSFPDASGTIALQEWVNAQAFLNSSKTLTAGTGFTGSSFNNSADVTFTNNVSTGIAGGQSINGGTGTGENLTINSTTHATKGFINFGSASTYDEANVRLGINSTAPTHALTFGLGASGLAMYNSADQTTNYDRFTINWASNVLNIANLCSSQSLQRAMRIGISTSTTGGSQVPTRYIQINPSGNIFDFNINSTSIAGNTINFGANTYSATSGSQTILALAPTVTQSGSAGFKGLLISPFLSQQGTGSYNLIDAGTNTAGNGTGTHTSKFVVDASGNTKMVHIAGLSSAPAIIAGAAAGTSPSVSVSGTDMGGEITLTTGTSLSTGTLLTVTFATAYGAAPKGHIISAYNGQAATDISKVFITSVTTTGFVISAQTALTPSTQYQWSYTIIQ